jgi:hypothetical protein
MLRDSVKPARQPDSDVGGALTGLGVGVGTRVLGVGVAPELGVEPERVQLELLQRHAGAALTVLG